MHEIVLFGVRSPLVVEYEETCNRLGVAIRLGISVNGAPRLRGEFNIVTVEELASHVVSAPFLACAFAPGRRMALFDMAAAHNLQPAPALIDPTAILSRSVRVEAGSYVNAGVVIGSQSSIGRNALVNRSASLGHHTLLGDHVSIGPGAVLAGNIHVGEGSMVGAGATILPNMRIGAGCLIGAGAVVIDHVADGTFVAGNPARPHRFDPAKSSLYVEDGE
jgi:sugar O-acyltransferase (sialic acid O-acetyltransferase NeuD family)